MIIEKLDLLAYGRFTDHSLDLSAGPNRFHIVYGPNESGKSTCLRAIGSLFFGIANKTTDNFLHANKKLRIGATLKDEDEGQLSLIRRKGNKDTLLDSDGKTVLDSNALLGMLGGIDETTFHHRFGLSHEQLVKGGQAIVDSEGDMGEILFAAGAGVGQLKSIEKQLETESAGLYKSRSPKSAIRVLIKQVDEKRKQLRELQTLPAHYQKLKKELELSLKSCEQLEGQLTELKRNLRRGKDESQAIPIIPTWNQAVEKLQPLADVPVLDTDFSRRRRDAAAQQETSRQLIQSRQRDVNAIQEKLDALSIDPLILGQAKQIESLYQDVAARRESEKLRNEVTQKISDLNRQLVHTLQDLGIDTAQDEEQQAIDALIDGRHITDSLRHRITDLVSRHGVCIEAARQAKEEQHRLKNLLEELDDELEQTPGTADPKTLTTVLEETGRPADLAQAVHSQQSDCDHAELRCKKQLQELGLGQLSLEKASNIAIPTQSAIDDWEQRLGEQDRKLESLGQQTEQLVSDRTSTQKELNSLIGENPLPTQADLQTAREDRDVVVDELGTDDCAPDQLSRTQANLRKSIRGADDVADQIRAHQEKVLQRETEERKLEKIGLELERVQAERQEAEANRTADQTLWEELWQPCQITPESPRRMADWLAKYRTFVDFVADLAVKRLELRHREERVQKATQRLTSVLRIAWSARPVTATPIGDSDESFESMTLESAHDAAAFLRDELQNQATRLRDVQKSHDETLRKLAKIEADHEAAADRLDQWNEEWQQSVQSFADAANESPQTIDARLRKVESLFGIRKERDEQIYQRKKAENNIQAFENATHSVAALAGIETQDGTAGVDIAADLYRKLKQAIDADNRQKEFRSTLESLNEALQNNHEEQQKAASELAQLCSEVGIESAGSLPDLEEKSSAKSDALQEKDKAESLLRLLADGKSVEAFVKRVETLDTTELEQQIAQQQRQVDELTTELTRLQQRVGAQQVALAAIDGGDKAADLNQEIQLLCGRIQHQSRDWAKRRVSSLILRQAIDHYRSENESPVLKIACDAFRDLTCNRYSGLQSDFDDRDRQTLHGIKTSANGLQTEVAVDAMSLGTADALYLALRLASLEHQLSSGHAIPVIIDDCLIQLDDDRTVAALRRLSRLSQSTQVILFTHHQHVIELATANLEEGEFHLHQLPA